MTLIKNIRILVIAVTSFVASFSCFAEGSVSHYQQSFAFANQYYEVGKFDEALETYLSIIQADFESSELYFNTANTYFKLKQIPLAVLYYEKALKLNPADPDIKFNLEYANTMITDQIEAIPEFIISKLWKRLVHQNTPDSWGMWVVILMFLSAVLFIVYLFSNQMGIKKAGFWAGSVSLGFAILFYIFAYSGSINIDKNKTGIVFTPSVTTKSSPAINSTDLFVIHEGTKVKIMEKVNDWTKVSLADGKVGWLKQDDIRGI